VAPPAPALVVVAPPADVVVVAPPTLFDAEPVVEAPPAPVVTVPLLAPVVLPVVVSPLALLPEVVGPPEPLAPAPSSRPEPPLELHAEVAAVVSTESRRTFARRPVVTRQASIIIASG
jgi:hypothetical protein